MPYYKLCDKELSRHKEPKKRAKIARAKLREQITGRLNQAQKLLLDTMVPIALRLDEMAQHYGEPGFDMRLYLDLQSSFRRSFERLQAPPRRAQAASTGGFDLEDVLDA